MDRGNKLWEGHRLLLPQHRDLILEEKQKAKEYHPPELAADELEALDRTIRWSRAKKRPIVLTYASKYGPKRCTGVVLNINLLEGWIILQSGEEKRLIPLSKIVGAEAATGGEWTE
ncbi:MAG: YolD-like family protein [Planifilum fulgidum]